VTWALAGAAVIAGAEATMSVVALPHLIGLDLAVNDAVGRAYPEYATHGTFWPPVTRTTWLDAGSAAGLALLALLAHRKRRSPRIALVAAKSAVLATVLTSYDPLPSSKDEQLTLSLARDLGAGHFQDESYLWYPKAVSWLGLALWAFLCAAVVAAWVRIFREGRPNRD
jgi:hypothetical protein